MSEQDPVRDPAQEPAPAPEGEGREAADAPVPAESVPVPEPAAGGDADLGDPSLDPVPEPEESDPAPAASAPELEPAAEPAAEADAEVDDPSLDPISEPEESDPEPEPAAEPAAEADAGADADDPSLDPIPEPEATAPVPAGESAPAETAAEAAALAGSGGGGEGDDTPAAKPAEGEGKGEGEDEDSLPEMGLLDHLNDLRKRLCRSALAVLVGFLACYAFAEDIFNFLLVPLRPYLPKGSGLIFTSPPEAFFTYMLAAAVAGLFLVSPYVFYQLWLFVAPGLYEHERKWIIPIALCSAVFFLCGAAFAYFVVFPYAFQFFMSYARDIIQAQLKMEEYLSFTLKLLVAFGIAFELPLFVFFLSRLGMVTAKGLRKFRQYAILIIFIAAAILTPPDVVSQLAMAAPLLLLYELSIWVAHFFSTKREAADEAESAPAADEEKTGEKAG